MDDGSPAAIRDLEREALFQCDAEPGPELDDMMQSGRSREKPFETDV